ncbi:MAG: hypothetical protein E2582_08835 [Delftia sp.]|uniref:TniQ family protein n=1 Tax=Delftia tsuruhatensis TaxID=180282 RepID=UPI0008E5CD6C|nr:hypothetical protein [Delftia sp.]SFB45359.1 TniQ protein [Delftia tsuruhatensis]
MTAVPWHLPFNDELLSSWLARVAVHSGCDPLTLTGVIWPKWRAWTLDVDRGVSPMRAEQAAQWLECSPDAVHATTLRELCERILGRCDMHRPVMPWIVALGCRNRLHYAGLPCCPLCLASDPQPFFRRTWRLAFVVGCETHGTRLIDRCPGCCALIEPHRCIATLQSLGRCAACGIDLRCFVPPSADADALSFQRIAMQVLATGEGQWEGAPISRIDWFRCVRGLITPSRCQVVRPEHSAADVRPNDLVLEMQPPREREARLCRLGVLLCHSAGLRGPGSFRLKARPRSYRSAAALPVAKELVQADWERWLRRNRLW